MQAAWASDINSLQKPWVRSPQARPHLADLIAFLLDVSSSDPSRQSQFERLVLAAKTRLRPFVFSAIAQAANLNFLAILFVACVRVFCVLLVIGHTHTHGFFLFFSLSKTFQSRVPLSLFSFQFTFRIRLKLEMGFNLKKCPILFAVR